MRRPVATLVNEANAEQLRRNLDSMQRLLESAQVRLRPFSSGRVIVTRVPQMVFALSSARPSSYTYVERHHC